MKQSPKVAPEMESYVPSGGISKFSVFMYIQIPLSQDKATKLFQTKSVKKKKPFTSN